MVNDSTSSPVSAVAIIQHGSSAKYSGKSTAAMTTGRTIGRRVRARLRRTGVQRGCAGGSFVSVADPAWKKRINRKRRRRFFKWARVRHACCAADNYLFMLMCIGAAEHGDCCSGRRYPRHCRVRIS